MVSEHDMNYAGGYSTCRYRNFAFGSLDGQPMLLERQTIITGERVQGAQSGLDENGRPQVNIPQIQQAADSCKMPHCTAVGKADSRAIY